MLCCLGEKESKKLEVERRQGPFPPPRSRWSVKEGWPCKRRIESPATSARKRRGSLGAVPLRALACSFLPSGNGGDAGYLGRRKIRSPRERTPPSRNLRRRLFFPYSPMCLVSFDFLFFTFVCVYVCVFFTFLYLGCSLSRDEREELALVVFFSFILGHWRVVARNRRFLEGLVRRCRGNFSVFFFNPVAFFRRNYIRSTSACAQARSFVFKGSFFAVSDTSV